MACLGTLVFSTFLLYQMPEPTVSDLLGRDLSDRLRALQGALGDRCLLSCGLDLACGSRPVRELDAEEDDSLVHCGSFLRVAMGDEVVGVQVDGP